ncbi:hypothetical protein CEUSTIGMA_g13417.t1 [Chlamydomonas eustigma]|uniref:Guanylate cyclase domain-containing protein n=1 Tax=Chlamydomonas eustigma TaxID=1157962 RepID=A0A250XSD2_9CHLO|nr:hypothetical protein CEUSTIGMA_g13417.t1 [Chlamydomonas eustigma]|eukprot:GAX86001.1 hypothetical protein CEUSTIGMA_g13417.t1 [Chlamydomonas eustigma]
MPYSLYILSDKGKAVERQEHVQHAVVEMSPSLSEGSMESDMDEGIDPGDQYFGQEGASGMWGNPSAAEEVMSNTYKNGSSSGIPRKSSAITGVIKSLVTLSPFVPKMLKEGIAENANGRYSAFDTASTKGLVGASKTLRPTMAGVQLAMMIADVKGFTALTEILSKKGTAGVELLTNCMNNYFTRVISLISSYDGDVIKFAGDSMIVAFCPSEAEKAEAASLAAAEAAAGGTGVQDDLGLRAATLRCAQCAHQLATRLGHMRMKMNGQVEPLNKSTTYVAPGAAASSSPAQLSGRMSRPSEALNESGTVSLLNTFPGSADKVLSRDFHADSGGSKLNPFSRRTGVESEESSYGAGSEDLSASRGAKESEAQKQRGDDAPTEQLKPLLSVPARVDSLTRTDDVNKALNSAGGMPSGISSSIFKKGKSIFEGRERSPLTGRAVARPSEMEAAAAGARPSGMAAAAGASSVDSSMLSSSTVGTPQPSGESGSVLKTSVSSSRLGHLNNRQLISPGQARTNPFERGRAMTDIAGPSGSSSKSSEAGLWGAEGLGVLKREMSVASKLNLPPSLRVARPTTGSAGSAGSMIGSGLVPASAASPAGISRHTGGGSPGMPPTGRNWESTLQVLRAVTLSPAEASSQQQRNQQESGSNKKHKPVSPMRPERSRLSQSSKHNLAEVLDDSLLRKRTASEFDLLGVGNTTRRFSMSGRQNLQKKIFNKAKRGSTGYQPQASEISEVGSSEEVSLWQQPADVQPRLSGPGAFQPSVSLELGSEAPSGALLKASPATTPILEEEAFEWSDDSYMIVPPAPVPVTQPVSYNSYPPPSSFPPNFSASGSVHQLESSSPLANVSMQGLVQSASSNVSAGVLPQEPSSTGSYPGIWKLARIGSSAGPASGPVAEGSEEQVGVSTHGRSRGQAVAEGVFGGGGGGGGGGGERRDANREEDDSLGEGWRGGPSSPNLAVASQMSNSEGTGGFISRVVSWFSSSGAGAASSKAGSHQQMPRPTQEILAALHSSSPRTERSESSTRTGPSATPSQTHMNASFTAARFHHSLTPGAVVASGQSVHGGSTAAAAAAAVQGRLMMLGAGGRGPRVDPILEEVRNAEFSLKIMVSAGCGCAFHVGGSVDEAADSSLPEIPHWEFFVGDRPLAPLLDEFGRRGCFAQLSAVEDHSEAAEVVVSPEAVALIKDDWELEQLPDEGGGRILGLKYQNWLPQATESVGHEVGRGSSGIQISIQSGGSKNPGLLNLAAGSPPSHPKELQPGISLSKVNRRSSAPHQVLNDGQSSSRCESGEDTGEDSSSSQRQVPRRALTARSNMLSEVDDSAARMKESNSTVRVEDANVEESLLNTEAGVSSHDIRWSSAQAEPGVHVNNNTGLSTTAKSSHQDTSPSLLNTMSGLPPLPIAPQASSLLSQQQKQVQDYMSLSSKAQRRMAGMLRMHVVGSVRSHIEAGHLDFINEIRPLTCLFIGFPSLLEVSDTASHSDQLEGVQFVVQQVQEVMRRWDGTFLQFRCDEKGFLGICALGLPGHTHEDDPSRGIMAALELLSHVKKKGHRSCVGVTTGRLLCTCVGARKIRSEYTVFGDAINLSARLMVKSKKGAAEILCDEPTYAHAKYKASYKALEPMVLKGKQKPVTVYSVSALDSSLSMVLPRIALGGSTHSLGPQKGRSENGEPHGDDEVEGPARPLVGRNDEMTLILGKAASMMSGEGIGGAVLIEGNTGMGKTKLLSEVRVSLDLINAETAAAGGQQAFNMFLGMADTANKVQKLHPWRQVFREVFQADCEFSKEELSPRRPPSRGEPAVITQLGVRLAAVLPRYEKEVRQQLADLLSLPLSMIPTSSDNPSSSSLGRSGSHAAAAAALLPGSLTVDVGRSGGGGSPSLISPSLINASSTRFQRFSLAHQSMVKASSPVHQQQSPSPPSQPSDITTTGPFNGGIQSALPPLHEQESKLNSSPSEMMLMRASTMLSSAAGAAPSQGSFVARKGSAAGGVLAGFTSGDSSIGRKGPPRRMASFRGQVSQSGGSNGGSTGLTDHSSSMSRQQQQLAQRQPSSLAVGSLGSPSANSNGAPTISNPIPQKSALAYLTEVLKEFLALYGPVVLLLENLHDFDTWSWQLLVKVSEELSSSLLVVASTRPNQVSDNKKALAPLRPSFDSGRPTADLNLHGKAALYQRVAMLHRQLLSLPTTTSIALGPFNFEQTRELMQIVGEKEYSADYVRAIMEKTGGMPLYIEMIVDFFNKRGPTEGGGDVADIVNAMSFQQVIIERMDRLKPRTQLCLKVASVMGQWVDLDILYKYYPIKRSRAEIQGYLQALERAGFLRATDTDDVWEFNMVERDVVYKVVPHYQRRRLHAQLAQELERSLEEQHVGALTTIAYHWNQACTGNEVTEPEYALKAIEYWSRAADVAYENSSLVEALRLYQKASQIAETLSDSVGEEGDHFDGGATDEFDEEGQLPDGPGFGLDNHHHERSISGPIPTLDEHGALTMSGTGGDRGSGGLGDSCGATLGAVKGQRMGPLDWSLISRLTRAQWEKSMASCCLGMVLQHSYGELGGEEDYYGSEDHFLLLTDHAIRGLLMLGAPHPSEILGEDEVVAAPLPRKKRKQRSGLSWLFPCLCVSGGDDEMEEEEEELSVPGGLELGLTLSAEEVDTVRDILLVLIIAAESHSLNEGGGEEEFLRLLLFCRRVCRFFLGCYESSRAPSDPLEDVRMACSTRINNRRSLATDPVTELELQEQNDWAA